MENEEGWRWRRLDGVGRRRYWKIGEASIERDRQLHQFFSPLAEGPLMHVQSQPISDAARVHDPNNPLVEV
jgi:hypothetical protein